MKERLEAIRERALAQINETDSLDKLNDIRVAFLGKKGELTEVLKGMKDVAPEDRPKVGQIVNETRQAIEEVLEKAKTELAAKKREFQLKSEVIDVTLPSKSDELGHKHPNTLALEEIQKIFIGMGYEVVDGPEVEYDYYNFEALNIPANHPAKDEQDTFYINDKIVLRTQTSPVQARVMPVTTDNEELVAYAQKVCDALEAENVRVELDARAEKLGYRMREGQVQKVPYLLVIGNNEKEENTVSYRLHGEQKTTTVSLDEFVEKVKTQIATKALEIN